MTSSVWLMKRARDGSAVWKVDAASMYRLVPPCVCVCRGGGECMCVVGVSVGGGG